MFFKKHSDSSVKVYVVCLCVCAQWRGKTALTQRLSSVLLQDIVSQERGMSERDRGKERQTGESEPNGARQRGEKNRNARRGSAAEDGRGKDIFSGTVRGGDIMEHNRAWCCVCVQEKERELVLKSIVTGGKSVCVSVLVTHKRVA